MSKHHIVYLVEAAASRQIAKFGSFSWYWGNNQTHQGQIRPGDWNSQVEAANMLWRENIKSVSARYPNESSATLPGPRGVEFVVEDKDLKIGWMEFNPVQVLKSAQCYSYQSCEHDEWEQSEAFAFIRSLKDAAIHSLPGYEQAEWGSPDPTVRRLIVGVA